MFSPRVGGQFGDFNPCVSQIHVRQPLLSSILHDENGRIFTQLSCEETALGMSGFLSAADNNPFIGFERSEFDHGWFSCTNQPRRIQTFPEVRQWNNAGNSSPKIYQAGSFCPHGPPPRYRPVCEGSLNQGWPVMSFGDAGIANEDIDCVYCGGRFSRISNLLRHERAHRQEPFWPGRRRRNRRARYDACDKLLRFYKKTLGGTTQTRHQILLYLKCFVGATKYFSTSRLTKLVLRGIFFLYLK